MMHTKLVVMLLGLALVSGCLRNRPANPATTRPVTDMDPKMATVEYWVAQPATANVSLDDFTRLWQTCEEVARVYLMPIERRDYRGGMLVAGPVISKQLFEFWRRDTGSFGQTVESSLGTERRTIFFEFTQNPAGGYVVSPKVVIERQAKLGQTENRPTPDTPPTYWYALRRDAQMEAKVVAAIERKLEQK